MLEPLILQAKNLKDEGQGLIEYALIVLLISIVVFVVLDLIGVEVNGVFEAIVNVFSA